MIRCLLTIFALIAVHVPSTEGQPLNGAKTWAYQLQQISISELATSPYDVLVIDYSLHGDKASEFTAAEIQSLKDSRKIVLSYLSIGEAEDYRFYFSKKWIKNNSQAPCGKEPTTKAPAWLDEANENWCGNYKTRYWSKAWQKIIFGKASGPKKSYLDKIIDAGFDGVYLDIIDGYEYWLDKPRSERRRTAAKDMAKFVAGLSNYARITKSRPSFIVVPQNGSSLISILSEQDKALYLGSIDGIGAEDTFYFGNRDEDNELNVQESLDHLRKFKQAGKVVLSIDYLTDPLKITDYFARACGEGFIPQVSLRELNTLGSHQTTECPS